MSKTTNFPTRAAVLRHLLASGWQIGTTMFYRHTDEGRLARSADGTYSAAAVTTYANNFCRRLSTGKKLSAGIAEQRDRVALERAKVALQKEQRALERLEARTIPVEAAELMIVGRAVAMISHLRAMVQMHASDLIHIMGGNQAKAPELIADIQAHIETHVESYATDLLQAIAARAGAAPGEVDA
jgi:hypothetical protein